MGNGKIFGALSVVCLMLDKELGGRSINLSLALGRLPRYRKKCPKREHSAIVIQLHSLYHNILKAIGLRKKSTRIDKWSDIKHAFKNIVSLMKLVDAEAEQMASNSSVEGKLLKSVTVDEEEWKRGYMKGRFTKCAPRGFETCVHCGHDSVDLPPSNEVIASKNMDAMNLYTK